VFGALLMYSLRDLLVFILLTQLPACGVICDDVGCQTGTYVFSSSLLFFSRADGAFSLPLPCGWAQISRPSAVSFREFSSRRLKVREETGRLYFFFSSSTCVTHSRDRFSIFPFFHIYETRSLSQKKSEYTLSFDLDGRVFIV